MYLSIRLLLLCIISVTTSAQDIPSPCLSIGDPAPPLRVREWLKGEPIYQFMKGKTYVIEFWATWCAPCKAAMPHLSNLAQEYKNKIVVIGVDIMEDKRTTLKKIKDFVDSMGLRMDYTVAIQDSNFMQIDWLDASNGQWKYGIPRTFVVNEEGKLAWIGHPSKLSKVLYQITNNSWDIAAAAAKQKSDMYLAALDDSLNYELMKYREDRLNPDDLGKPDLALLAIDEIIRKEPRLQYAPLMASNTFSALLKINPLKAYQYGKVAILTPTYIEAPYDFIIGSIETYSEKLKLPEEIYRLGAEAHQIAIDDTPYPELVNIPKRYNSMADWYWKANEKTKAIDAQTKAIEELKKRKNFSKKDLSLFEARLKRYKISS
ncbi:MAG: TlpA family protein disulfide reductase [Chitinophagaceae bacterium]|nr:TlpA family protein disulfide reductase [Chitinophagaceae bacterium]